MKAELQEKAEILSAKEFIKNPTVLDFLDLPSSHAYTEAELVREIEQQRLLFEQEHQ